MRPDYGLAVLEENLGRFERGRGGRRAESSGINKTNTESEIIWDPFDIAYL
jgi:hypothetical protein